MNNDGLRHSQESTSTQSPSPHKLTDNSSPSKSVGPASGAALDTQSPKKQKKANKQVSSDSNGVANLPPGKIQNNAGGNQVSQNSKKKKKKNKKKNKKKGSGEEKSAERKVDVNSKQIKRNKKPVTIRGLDITDDRLKAYGIRNPKKFKNAMIFGNLKKN